MPFFFFPLGKTKLVVGETNFTGRHHDPCLPFVGAWLFCLPMREQKLYFLPNEYMRRFPNDHLVLAPSKIEICLQYYVQIMIHVVGNFPPVPPIDSVYMFRRKCVGTVLTHESEYSAKSTGVFVICQSSSFNVPQCLTLSLAKRPNIQQSALDEHAGLSPYQRFYLSTSIAWMYSELIC